jgi:DNA-binding transcriptional ArsR family regulator
MPKHSPDLDAVLHGLANPTRRAVVERLSGGPASVGMLAEPFDMALSSFMQHLQVLEACNLVRSTKEGRVRTVRIVPETLRETEGWLAEQRRLWTRRLDQLDAYVETLEAEEHVGSGQRHYCEYRRGRECENRQPSSRRGAHGSRRLGLRAARRNDS